MREYVHCTAKIQQQYYFGTRSLRGPPSSVVIELLSSSARVTSVKSQQGLSLFMWGPHIPKSDKNLFAEFHKKTSLLKINRHCLSKNSIWHVQHVLCVISECSQKCSQECTLCRSLFGNHINPNIIVFIPGSSASGVETWKTPPRPRQTFAGQVAPTLSPANKDTQSLVKQISSKSPEYPENI